MDKPFVFIAMPRRHGEHPIFEAAQSFFAFTKTPEFWKYRQGTTMSSLLTFGFNRAWAMALNFRKDGVNLFAMQHSDVVPEIGWLDVLWEEMQRTGADLISTVIPIKGQSGHTSTALKTDDPFKSKILTLRECFAREETWTEEGLQVNSGLMLVKLVGRHLHPMPLFRQTDKIELDERGAWVAHSLSEDWDFSNQITANGGKVFATRKVQVWHGRPEFNNWSAWGTHDNGRQTSIPGEHKSESNGQST